MAGIPTTQHAATAQRHFDFLGLDVTVRSDRPETLTLLDTVYGHFGTPHDTGAPDLSLSLTGGSGPDPVLEVLGTSHPLAAAPLTDIHVYAILLGELFQRLGAYFLIHGAVVTDGTHSLLVAGPSGHGKTTLSLELVGRDFRLLSDDFAPLGRSDGRVYPFPKRVGVKRATDSSSPELPRAFRGEDSPPLIGGKWWLDPADLPGGVPTESSPLTHLLLLEPEGSRDPEQTAVFRLALIHGREAFEGRLADLAGVNVKPLTTPTGWPALEVAVNGGTDALAEFYEACSRARHQILYFESCSPERSFAEPAALTPCETLPAAMSLMREVLNRVPGGALLDSANGSLGQLLTELAAALQNVRCARLRVGERDATTDLVTRWLASETT